jgi:ABC-type cobalamin/Fe3+-siderophores transport system ATPase subunit
MRRHTDPRAPTAPSADAARPAAAIHHGRLVVAALSAGYNDRTMLDRVSLHVPDGSFTAIIGPNGCGKSTLLKAMAGHLRPTTGSVRLDGRDVTDIRPKALARELALLPQTSSAPDGITVVDLVSRGRFPHQSLLHQWSQADEDAVTRALELTGCHDLADRPVHALSGGQRQRVWIAMVLAQSAPIMLLDEPTTFLDITRQLDVLRLCRQLRAERDVTLVAVLHDLNLAFRFATHLVVMRDGRVLAEGAPDAVVTPDLLAAAFDLDARVLPDPETGAPMVVPRAR